LLSRNAQRSCMRHSCRAFADSPRVYSEQGKAVASDRILTGSWSVHVSQRLHIWADDIADAANFRVVVNLVNDCSPLPERILKSFDCNIKPDFVTKLETVSNGLRSRIDANRDALHLEIFNSDGQRSPREPDNSQRRTANCWSSRSLWQGDPNWRWTLP